MKTFLCVVDVQEHIKFHCNRIDSKGILKLILECLFYFYFYFKGVIPLI